MFSNHLSVLRQVWNAPGNSTNRPLALLRAFRWFIACHRVGTSPSDQPTILHPAFGNRVYPCYTDSIIAKHVQYRSEWFDHDLLHFMNDHLRPGDHFLDVGANTGLHTLLASTRITTGRITCVEPDPQNLARLRRALDLNHITNATILPVAASDQAGTIQLTGSDVFTRISPSPDLHVSPSPLLDVSAAISADSARLDALLGPDTRVDFCKIDVEGAEWQVLKGMTGIMERDALPVIAFEFNGSLCSYGHSEDEFLNWLRQSGYVLATYHHDRKEMHFTNTFTAADHDLFAFTQTGTALLKERLPEVHCRS